MEVAGSAGDGSISSWKIVRRKSEKPGWVFIDLLSLPVIYRSWGYTR